MLKELKYYHFIESENEFSSIPTDTRILEVIHYRKFITNSDSIHIYDELKKQDIYDQIAHFHFHPSIEDLII